ncbi:N-acetylmuramoyl-L-alanine amidase [Lysinibacillus sp. NPDC097287]|uniref:N-acetylmuramoyl-L-alanine amidase n=1 Tax=Lysinibacillus sp. NPDC097287 TaxID=3364144 RepID=UPI00382E087C
MITISPGHWCVGSGTSDILDEVEEARKVVNRVEEILKANKIPTIKIEDNVSKSQANNLSYLVRQHNTTKRKVDVSVHFNVSKERVQHGIGTEVLYYDAVSLAATMSKAISNASGLKNRGAKKRQELAFLNGTTMPAILIEVCFVNSAEDVKLYEKHFDKICTVIAEVLATYVGHALTPTIPTENIIFSTNALTEKVHVLLQNTNWRQQVIAKGIEMDAFMPVWPERQLNDIDFLGLCAILSKKLI